MSSLRKLIREVHRRSLWQVLGIYVGASWALLAVVDTMAGALNLPDWAASLALFLLVIGLPVVLATAFVQEGMTTKEPEARPQPLDEVGEVPPPSAPEPTARQRLLTWRNALLGGVAAFALLGVATAGWLLLGLGSREEAATDGQDRASIAVLPLENMSPDPADEFFTDGMHEEIIAQLAKIAALRVISRTSVHQYENTQKTTPTIAGELGVAHLHEGSVRRAGDRVRIILQLIKAETDDHLWAQTYEEELTTENIFAIQSDVAQQLARALRASCCQTSWSGSRPFPPTTAQRTTFI